MTRGHLRQTRISTTLTDMIPVGHREARVKRKGGTARDRLKEAWNEIAT